ncbi:ATP-binding protein [Caldithrix abyssi]
MVNYPPDDAKLSKKVCLMIFRRITPKILQALKFSPVVLLNGARQTGKTTLVKAIAKEKSFRYVTLDDLTTLHAAKSDPQGFIAAFDKPLIIDEAQRVPELLLAIKAHVDQSRQPGQFLLTGSANALMLPKISESLVGRMVILTLFPLSYDEIRGQKNTIIDDLVEQKINSTQAKEISKKELFNSILLGGFPELQKLANEKQKKAWFQSYISTILQRDIQDLARINGIFELPRLFSFLGYQAGSLLNLSNLSRELGMPVSTLKRYVTLLEAIFLVHRLPAWFRNLGKRLIKTPKVFFNDSGLLSHLLGVNAENLESNPKISGQLFENFVFQELIKQISWSESQPELYYFRTAAGKEVDFILETNNGQLIGIEIKLKETIQSKDFDGLRELMNLTNGQFKAGYVLSLSKEVVPFGNNLFTLPLSLFLQDFN